MATSPRFSTEILGSQTTSQTTASADLVIPKKPLLRVINSDEKRNLCCKKAGRQPMSGVVTVCYPMHCSLTYRIIYIATNCFLLQVFLHKNLKVILLLLTTFPAGKQFEEPPPCLDMLASLLN